VLNLPEGLILFLAASFTTILRLLAIHFKWQLPSQRMTKS
jgi:uncharacterized membrane protein YeiH